MINATSSVVLTTPYMSLFERKILNVFCEEVEIRSGIKLPQMERGTGVVFEFYNEDNIKEYSEILEYFDEVKKAGKEGFRIRLVHDKDEMIRIITLGKDERGEFYGMARVLRKLTCHDSTLLIPESLDGVSITPQYPMRGHQLGYRDKNNTYSAWSISDFERYIRDMALFGSNSIELLPPKTDDHLYSAKFQEDPFVVMNEVAKIIHSYHMDVWLWYPNVGRDYADLDCLHRELQERETVFAAIPYLDAVLVPLGDPGSLWPTDAFKVTEEFVRIMHKYHPQAKVWVAPQHFQPEPGWYDAFYAEIAKEPSWIDGVCFAPWEQHDIVEMQDKLPQKYKNNIRNYPDVSHNTNCQFPVPEWDDAYALTEGRESYNARPEGMRYIHNLIEPHTCGSITYSEGIHDDVNKVIWGDQDFDSTITAQETLEDYARMFIDSDHAEEIASLIISAEKNWEGPILQNKNIDITYRNMQDLDSRVGERARDNYRYQMLRLRVLTDYWVRNKYQFDQDMEERARKVIEGAVESGSTYAIKEARGLLNECLDHPAAEDILFEMERLADSLYRTCHIQLTTKHHMGQRWIRGAYLETARMPLNDYQYLMQSFKKIERLDDEDKRIEALLNLNARKNPGEGSWYYNLGTYEGFKHVTRHKTWEEDPGYLKTPLMDHSIYSIMGLYHEMSGWHYEFPMPLSWATNATALYGTPLEVTFDGLDSEAQYELRVFYPNSFLKAVFLMQVPEEDTQVHFWAGDHLLADSIPKQEFATDVYWSYDLPQDSYRDGTLRLRWQVYGILKAFAVSDIWIIKKSDSSLHS